jgi:ABC-type transport system involved in multi-copper enzyme maturation permease subunit
MSDWMLLANSLRDALRPRRLATTLLLVLLPALVGFTWRSLAEEGRYNPDETYNSIAVNMVFGFILTILCVVHGTNALLREIEGRTIVYLLTRPMPRWRILVVKYLAAWIIVSATVCLSAVFLGISLFDLKFGPRVLPDLRILPVGAATYCALFLLLATILPRQLFALLFSLLFAVGWENLVSVLPGGFARLSVMAHLRVLAPHLKETADATTAGSMDPTKQLLSFEPAVITSLQAWIGMGATTFVALVVALVVFRNREYSPREEGG